MGNKVKVRARQTRGAGTDAQAGLAEMLVTNYAETKAEYDKLNDDEKAAFDTILGDLAEAFKTGPAMTVELTLNTLEAADCETLFEQLNEQLGNDE